MCSARYTASVATSASAAREDRVHAIADGLENHTALRIDRLPQDRIVARKGCWHRLWVLLPQLRAAFDVGEAEGERAGGQPGSSQVRKFPIRCDR